MSPKRKKKSIQTSGNKKRKQMEKITTSEPKPVCEPVSILKVLCLFGDGNYDGVYQLIADYWYNSNCCYALSFMPSCNKESGKSTVLFTGHSIEETKEMLLQTVISPWLTIRSYKKFVLTQNNKNSRTDKAIAVRSNYSDKDDDSDQDHATKIENKTKFEEEKEKMKNIKIDDYRTPKSKRENLTLEKDEEEPETDGYDSSDDIYVPFEMSGVTITYHFPFLEPKQYEYILGKSVWSFCKCGHPLFWITKLNHLSDSIPKQLQDLRHSLERAYCF
jgi:hypothetical protein